MFFLDSDVLRDTTKAMLGYLSIKATHGLKAVAFKSEILFLIHTKFC